MDEAKMDQLSEHAEKRLVAIPNTEGEVQAALGRLEELLGLVTAWQEEQPDRGDAGASQLTAGPSRKAVGRLASAVRAAETEPPAQPVAPEGRYELVSPCAGRCRACRPRAARPGRPGPWPAVGTSPRRAGGRCHARDGGSRGSQPRGSRGRSRPASGTDGAGLGRRCQPPSACAPGERRARGAQRSSARVYQRVVDRILGIWHAGDSLAPFLYRGH